MSVIRTRPGSSISNCCWRFGALTAPNANGAIKLRSLQVDLCQFHSFRLFAKFIPKIRMGDADQRFDALLGGLAPQLGHSILGDHVIDIILAGRYMGARS